MGKPFFSPPNAPSSYPHLQTPLSAALLSYLHRTGLFRMSVPPTEMLSKVCPIDSCDSTASSKRLITRFYPLPSALTETNTFYPDYPSYFDLPCSHASSQTTPLNTTPSQNSAAVRFLCCPRDAQCPLTGFTYTAVDRGPSLLAQMIKFGSHWVT